MNIIKMLSRVKELMQIEKLDIKDMSLVYSVASIYVQAQKDMLEEQKAELKENNASN